MVDTSPLDRQATAYTTSPPTNVGIVRTRPAMLKQLGRSTSYISNGDNFVPVRRPHYYHLAAWDRARRKEPVLKDGLDKIKLAVLSKMGEYIHPDSEINDFINANLEGRVQRWIGDLTISALWSGFGVSENIFIRKEGPRRTDQIWIDDLANYHPTQVELRLNDHSRLTHGEKIDTSELLSGVWVPTPNTTRGERKPNGSYTGGMIRLPRFKVVHTALGDEHNNPWGTSVIESVLEYHLFKEAFRDMMAVALDRYGSPLIYAIVPPQMTDEVVATPDGGTRNLTYREVVSEALTDLRSQQAIVLEQMNKDHPVTLNSLTTGNNFADVFTSAIDLCDKNMMMGLGIPNLIVRDERSGLGNGNSSENQVELFHTFISSIFDIVVGDFMNSTVKELIAFNFDVTKRPAARELGRINKLPFRFADTQVVIEAVEKMTKLGYLNPANEVDYNHVRNLLTFKSRKPDNYSKLNEATVRKDMEVKDSNITSQEANAFATRQNVQVAKDQVKIKNKEANIKKQIADKPTPKPSPAPAPAANNGGNRNGSS